jgi:hypothetical protein
MQISANLSSSHLYASYTVAHLQKSEGLQENTYRIEMQEQSFSYSYVSFELQSATADHTFQKEYEEFQEFLQQIGYEGRPIAQLSREQAAELVSEDGFFGIDKTAQRIADFVINGAGGNEELFRAGRDGVLRGFEEAEALWGGKLPDISYTTIEKAVELIDMAMHGLGFNIISTEV